MKKEDVLKKVNKVLLWLLMIAFCGAIFSTVKYSYETYNNNSSYTLNINPK